MLTPVPVQGGAREGGRLSLALALRLDAIAVYGRLATGKKYLIRPDS